MVAVLEAATSRGTRLQTQQYTRRTTSPITLNFTSDRNLSMDPLSVTASIVGIIAAAGKVVEILGPIVSSVKGAQSSAKLVWAEVESCVVILSALQRLFDKLDSVPEKRKQLVQLDHLVATFDYGVFLFEDLERLVVRFDSAPETIKSRVKWGYHEKDFAALLSRLQYFKSSMTLMLNILQW